MKFKILYKVLDRWQQTNATNSMQQYFGYIQNYYGSVIYDNIMMKYYKATKTYLDQFALSQWHIYGSSRIGIYNKSLMLVSVKFKADTSGGVFTNIHDSIATFASMDYNFYYLHRGEKQYELTNHLGNVMSVVSDKKIYHCSNAVIMDANFDAGYSNMYPVTGNTLSLSGNKLNVISSSSYSNQAGGVLQIEGKPGKLYKVAFDLTMGASTSSVAVELYSSYTVTNGGTLQDAHTFTSAGSKNYTFTASQGLLRVKFTGANSAASNFTIDNFVIREADIDSQYYQAEIISASDYSPFGAPLPERTYQLKSEPLVKTISTDNFVSSTSGWVADGSHSTVTAFYGILKAGVSGRGSIGEGMKKYFFTVPGNHLPD